MLNDFVNVFDYYRHWEKKGYFQGSEDFSGTSWNDSEGLRNWEINKGFTTQNMTKLTKRELFKVLRNSLTTFLFISFVALVLGKQFSIAFLFFDLIILYLVFINENILFIILSNYYLIISVVTYWDKIYRGFNFTRIGLG